MKIPKARKRGDAWRIEVMHQGKRLSSTHDTQKQAEEWAARKLLQLRDDEHRIELGELPQHTFSQLIDIYLIKVSPTKKGGDVEQARLVNFLRSFPELGVKPITQITPKDLVGWRNQRMLTVSAGTVKRDMNLLSSVLSYAQKELFWIKENPFNSVKRPTSPPARKRRVSESEIELIVAGCDYVRGTVPITNRHYVAWCFLFAIESAMRASEILSILPQHIYDKYVHLPNTKNGTERDVPILQSASDLLSLAMLGYSGVGTVIPLSSDGLKNTFKRVVDKCGIVGLTFHDTRHEAATRLARLVAIEDLSKITGHKELKILVNTYYNPTAIEIADRMRSKKT
jgi:integrase